MIKKVLLVDDDIDFIEAVKNFLEAADYTVEFENRDAFAMDKIRSFMPDLILLDVAMSSENSGFDVASKVNSDEKLKAIPIIFLTGYFLRKGLPRGDETVKQWSNVKYVLDKPVKPSLLLDIIKQIK
jgi:CheY-like chemotaxis protein